MLMCNWLIKRQALTGNQEKWFFTETCRSEVTTGLSAIKNVTENHFFSKFEFRQQTRCRINNRQTIWMNSIADLKKTLHTHSTQPLTTPATPFPHTCNSVRCARSSGSRKEKKHQAQTVLHQSVWNPVLTSWPQLHKDLQQITGAVRSLLMLQTLHHHPHTKDIQNYRTKCLQARGSKVFGHEVIWKTGAGPPERYHWTLFSLPTEQTGL